MEILDVFNVLLGVAAAVAAVIYLIIPIGRSLLTGSYKLDDDDRLGEKCRYDTRGLRRCTECGTETRTARRKRLQKLRDAWPTECIKPRIPAAHEQPVVILITDDGWAAGLICSHWEARGVPSRCSDPAKISDVDFPAARTSYRLTVWTEDEERARKILEHLWPEASRF